VSRLSSSLGLAITFSFVLCLMLRQLFTNS
jgi:hypothetical protein